MKRIITYMMAGVSLLATSSCSDFLDTVPYDALAPSNTWKTEDDAAKFLTGCYDGWIDEKGIFYWDCASDFGYSNFLWDNYQSIGNGTMAAGLKEVADYYNFGKIRSCNDFLINIEDVQFADEAKKKDMMAQVKVIRAYDYFNKNWQYGGVPIIDSYTSREEAIVPRNTEAEVNKFIEDELDAAIPMFLEDKASTSGYIDRATALAVKMRHALYYGNYERAKEAAQAIISMDKFDLEEDYARLFKLEGRDSKEIIASVQHIDQYGKFTAFDALMTQRALIAYSVGLIGLIVVKVLAPGFYSRQDIKTPVKIAIVTLILTQLMNLAFIGPLKHAGLSLSIGLAACLNASLLYWQLRKQKIFTPQPGWMAFLLRLVVAVLVMSGVLLGMLHIMPEWSLGTMPWRLLRLMAVVLAGIAAYFAALAVLGFKVKEFARRTV